MTCAARRAARALDKAGLPTWSFSFEHVPLDPGLRGCNTTWPRVSVGPADFCTLPGACHGCEIAFWSMDAAGMRGAQEARLAKGMAAKWNEFAERGSPGGGWPQYNESGDESWMFDLRSRAAAKLREKQCDFWDLHLPPKPA